MIPLIARQGKPLDVGPEPLAACQNTWLQSTQRRSQKSRRPVPVELHITWVVNPTHSSRLIPAER
jgi:hypothetical protein